MFTLATFYKSKQWEKCIRLIRMQRVDAEGRNICEHCGKPIIREYDCIGHHKQVLTEENVNDTNISLNPENIALVHHRCHNKIHEKLSFNNHLKYVYLIYGPPLSGKSTYVKEVMNEGDLIVDVDSIWECVSGLDRYMKPKRLIGTVLGVRDKLIEDIKFRRGRWNNAYVIGGYPMISERERLTRVLGAREIFIDTSVHECLERAEQIKDKRRNLDYQRFILDWKEKYHPPS